MPLLLEYIYSFEKIQRVREAGGNLNVEKKLWTIYSYGLEKLKQTTYEYTEEFIPETYPGNGEPIIIDGVPQLSLIHI